MTYSLYSNNALSFLIRFGCLCILLLQLSATVQGQYAKTGKAIDTLSIADPTIFKFQQNGVIRYYLYGTAADQTVRAGFKGFVSSDLHHWKRILHNNSASYLVLDSAHSYGNSGFWAPQVISLGGDRPLLMAYTASEQIAIARSERGPEGPFAQKDPAKLFEDGFKHIDPFIYRDSASGKTYIYYVKLDAGNKIYVAELQAMSGAEKGQFTVKAGTEKRCIQATTDWENTTAAKWPVTEGPTVLFHRGYYYLFYSANDFRNPDYSVGYATSKSPTGPWVKAADNPIITGAKTGLSGTGHGDVFQDKDGQYYYVFHAHHTHSAVGPRKTYITPFTFKASRLSPDRIKMDYHSVRPLLLTHQ